MQTIPEFERKAHEAGDKQANVTEWLQKLNTESHSVFFSFIFETNLKTWSQLANFNTQG